MSSARPAPGKDTLAAEQGYVSGLHRRLDDVRAASAQLATPSRAPRTTPRPSANARPPSSSTPSGWSPSTPPRAGSASAARPRDVDVPRHVGRIGLPAEDGDEEPLLIDWRAPTARPFYTATPLHDLGRAAPPAHPHPLDGRVAPTDILDLDDPTSHDGPGWRQVVLAALNATAPAG